MMRLGGVSILLLSMPLLATNLSKERATLDHSRNPDLLEAASVSIAASGDAAAIADLARHLGQRSFLHRLDPGGGSEPEVERLGHVFRSLAEHPSQSTEALCVALSGNAHFNEVPARLNFLLSALAAVRPMSEASAEVFRTTSRSDFLEVNGPLLAGNASPRALIVLAELFRDESLDVVQRVSIAHWGLLPNRTNADVVAMCVKLLTQGGLSRDLELAILESLYDYQAKLWFSTRVGQPTPPPWDSASPAARDALKSLATSRMSRPDLPPALRAAMSHTLAQLR